MISVVRFSTQKNLQLVPLCQKIDILHKLVPWLPPKAGESQETLLERNISSSLMLAQKALLENKKEVEGPGKQWVVDTKQQIAATTLSILSGKKFGFRYNTAAEAYPSSWTPNPKRAYSYSLKEGYTPAEGLTDFIKGPTTTDCGGAVEALFFRIIQQVIGDDKFNVLFSNPLSRLRMESQGSWAKTSLLHLFTRLPCVEFDSTDRSYIQPGTRVYFQGIPWYGIKHPTGIGSGYHAICLGKTKQDEPLYWVFGFEEPVTEKTISSRLISQYNLPQSQKDVEFIKNTPNFIEFIKKIHSGKLAGLDKQITYSYENPNAPCTLESLKKVGFGFHGPISVTELSPSILALIKEVSLEQLKAVENFPRLLSQTQMIHAAAQTIEQKEKLNQPFAKTQEADNFLRFSYSWETANRNLKW